MQNLTPKQIAILTAMKKIGGPSGVQKIMTESKGMESKIQVKNILVELVDLKAVVFQSNNQYRATPEALKNINVVDIAPALSVKPEAYQAKIKSLQAEIDTLKAHIKEAAKHASSQADHLYNLKSALGISGSGWLETIKQAADMRAELKKEKEDSITWLRYIADIRAAVGDNGKRDIVELIEHLKILRNASETLNYVNGELADIANLVSYNPHNHDNLSQAIAFALDINSTSATVNTAVVDAIKIPPTEQKRTITTTESIEHLSDLIGSIFDDQTRMVIYPTGIELEIIVHDSRFVIPTGVSDETDQFIEALSWISGQYIADEAA